MGIVRVAAFAAIKACPIAAKITSGERFARGRDALAAAESRLEAAEAADRGAQELAHAVEAGTTAVASLYANLSGYADDL
jgi:hypothetical protein